MSFVNLLVTLPPLYLLLLSLKEASNLLADAVFK